MNYLKIDIKKFSKLIHSQINFENNSFLYSEKELVEYVKNYKIKKIFSAKEEIYKNTLDLLINYTDQKNLIEIYLINKPNGLEVVFKNINSISQFLSLLKNKESFGYFSITGDKLTVENFIINYGYRVQDFEVESFKDSYYISWDIPNYLLNQSWGDQDYVIKKLNTLRKDEVEQQLKFINKDLWENQEFVEKLLLSNHADQFLSLICFDLITEDMFLRVILDNEKIFKRFWGLEVLPVFVNVREAISEFYTKKYGAKNKEIWPHNTALIENIKDIDVYSLNGVKPSDVFLVKKIYEEIFSKEEKCLSLLKDMNVSKEKIMKFFSPNVQSSDVIIEEINKILLKENYLWEFLWEFVPKSYFEDEKKTLNFLIKYSQTNLKSDLPSYITKHFIYSIDNIHTLLSNVKEKNFIVASVKVNNEQLFKTKDFLKVLIMNDYGLFNIPDVELSTYFKKYLTEDREIIDFIIKNKKYFLLSKIGKKVIAKISSREDILGLVRANPYILLNGEAPQNWKEDIEILMANKDFELSKLSKVEIGHIVQKNKDHINDLIKRGGVEFFLKLPSKIKNDEEHITELVNHFYAEILRWHNEKLNIIIPDQLMLNKKFCLNILKKSSAFARYIHEKNWTNYYFLKDLFYLIDKNQISAEVILKAPPQIKQCLDSFEVSVGGYFSFFEKFANYQSLQKNLNVNNNKVKTQNKI